MRPKVDVYETGLIYLIQVVQLIVLFWTYHTYVPSDMQDWLIINFVSVRFYRTPILGSIKVDWSFVHHKQSTRINMIHAVYLIYVIQHAGLVNHSCYIVYIHMHVFS